MIIIYIYFVVASNTITRIIKLQLFHPVYTLVEVLLVIKNANVWGS